MRLSHFISIAVPVLFLSACGSNAPVPDKPSSASEAAPAQQAAAATPASDDALAPLFGTWALDPNQCGGQVLKISKARFEGAENGCDITSFTDDGDGSYSAAMSCTSQGQTANETIKMRPIFAPTGEGIDLTYLNRENLAVTVLRCREPKTK